MSLFLILLLAFTITNVSQAAESNDYKKLRDKWVTKLTGGPTLNVEDADIAQTIHNHTKNATHNWEDMNVSENRNYLWSDLSNNNDPFTITESYNRLKDMALAYTTKGSTVYENDKLKQDIVSGLDWLYENRYNESKSETGNWWHWEIGSPMALSDLLILMDEELSPKQKENYIKAIDRFVPDPTRRTNYWSLTETGANRIDKSLIVIKRGITEENEEKILQGQRALGQVLLYTTKGDGFYLDGSFIQHNNVAYNGSYGYVLIDHLADILFLLQDSPWKVTDPNLSNVYSWIRGSYEPLIYEGVMMDMVRGRAISREAWQDYRIGREMATTLLLLAKTSPKNEADYIRSMVKSWVDNADQFKNFYQNVKVNDISLIKELLSDKTISAKEYGHFHKQFSAMDRVVHWGKGFTFGISMSSKRISNYELGNQENLRGWYTGQGMTYLYNGDITQYNDNFWPNIDHYRLPGTTSDGLTRKSGATSQSWVGGSSIENLYGVVGMELDPTIKTEDGSQASTLTGKKSWFMFDDEIVALGSGISSTTGTKVETIVENRKINDEGDNTLTVDGEPQNSSLSWKETLQNVEWAHLEGNTENADIGYYFPDAPNLSGKREKRTNEWSLINKLPEFATYEPSTRNFLSLAIKHGKNPVNDDYSYVLLPNKSTDQTSLYSQNPDINILSNTSDVQAVQEKKLGITAINFWGKSEIGAVSTEGPASVIMNEDGNQLKISVSDPTQNQGKVTVQFDHAAVSVLNKDENVNIVSMAPLVVEVFTSESKGKTYSATFEYVPTVNELDEAIDLGYQKGWITNSGILQSLQATVNNIQKHQDNHKKVIKGLKTLENKVHEHKGKKIDSYFSDLLLKVLSRLSGEKLKYEGPSDWAKNIAFNKNARASSSEVDYLSSDLAFDEDYLSRWSSNRTDNEWISVDLGDTYPIQKVNLHWEAAYAKKYKLQLSTDGENWEDVYSSKSSDGGLDTITIPTQEARYVRMLGVERATKYGYSLFEFEVYQSNPFEM
jgi:hypothetical protein